ncbi:MAG: radical SAM protein [Rhodovarius sp.]|nr:radical SAM protein [Rhodovarius sp.]
MSAVTGRIADYLSLLPRGGPALCNVFVTNLCNATCDFCNFAHDKGFVVQRSWMDADRFGEAMAILHREADLRFIVLTGGEPLLHPRLAEMAAAATAAGIKPSLVTNGWLLLQKLDALQAAGVQSVIISIDAPDAATHEKNRGLKGVFGRIREAIAEMKRRGMMPIASVAITRLVGDYERLADTLLELGFTTATFSYPRKEAFSTSSLVWADSALVDLSAEELISALDAIDALRRRITVQNPRASMEDLRRRLRGERERFVCHAGYKYFYLDWTYTLWRCEDWKDAIGPVWEFTRARMIRDGCQACTTDCYRDASVMLHAAVAFGDAIGHLSHGRLGQAIGALADRRVGGSIGAVAGLGRHLRHMAGLK